MVRMMMSNVVNESSGDKAGTSLQTNTMEPNPFISLPVIRPEASKLSQQLPTVSKDLVNVSDLNKTKLGIDEIKELTDLISNSSAETRRELLVSQCDRISFSDLPVPSVLEVNRLIQTDVRGKSLWLATCTIQSADGGDQRDVELFVAERYLPNIQSVQDLPFLLVYLGEQRMKRKTGTFNEVYSMSNSHPMIPLLPGVSSSNKTVDLKSIASFLRSLKTSELKMMFTYSPLSRFKEGDVFLVQSFIHTELTTREGGEKKKAVIAVGAQFMDSGTNILRCQLLVPERISQGLDFQPPCIYLYSGMRESPLSKRKYHQLDNIPTTKLVTLAQRFRDKSKDLKFAQQSCLDGINTDTAN